MNVDKNKIEKIMKLVIEEVNLAIKEGNSPFAAFLLDMEGICASSGSACTTGSREPSHVLTAIGVPTEAIRGSVRLTLSHETTQEEIDYTIDKMKEIIAKARSLSQDYADMQKRK